MIPQFIRHFDELPSLDKKIVLITDETIFSLYAEQLNRSFHPELVIQIPPGEQSKTREMKAFIEDLMLSKRIGREALIAAVGGGVVLDLAGFIAATYCRGIDYLSMPTTLMAMVDAAIGGKTAVNTPAGKNLIGAFHLPCALFYHLDFLKTLPEREWRAAMSEIIKYALIGDGALFAQLEQRWEVDEELILRCASHKQRIIQADYWDQGVRRTLNFGHTVGHALEHLSDYTLLHGEAVAIGLLAESFLSHELGFLPSAAFERIEALLKRRFSLEFSLVKADLPLDKKEGCVLISAIGKAVSFDGAYCTPLSPSLIWSALESLLVV